LNPGDNQGIRYSLLNLLTSQNRDAEALELIDQFKDDGMAEWAYTHALLIFRAEGSGKKANKLLREAQNINAHVPDYLTGKKRMPLNLPPYISWGGEDEAIGYASGYLGLWRQTAGAVDWLRGQTSTRRQSGKSKRGKK
jgi:hypothetical protein